MNRNRREANSRATITWRFDILYRFCFRLPTNFCWDTDDARFLACQTCRAPQIADKHVPPPPPPTTSIKLAANATEAKHPNHTLASGQESTTSRSQVVILFIKSGSNVEIKQMEHITLIVSEELVNLCAPYLVCHALTQHQRSHNAIC